MAYIVMAHEDLRTSYGLQTYELYELARNIVMAYIVMTYIAMAYIVMAHEVVMACRPTNCTSWQGPTQTK